MTRIIVICEGQTEEAFVKKVLSPYLAPRGVYAYAALLGRPGHKGGSVTFSRVLLDVNLTLKTDKNAFCTTFFDYFRMDAGFPGYEESCVIKSGSQQKAKIVCDALRQGIRESIGDDLISRFVPYVQMYEFEALLFSDVEVISSLIGDGHLGKLQGIRDKFDTPEDINNGALTAPSKRLTTIDRSYNKVINGELISEGIGVDKIRMECPGFDAWLRSIEALTA